MRHSQSFERQRGVVIVVALFIVALVATMAYLMMERLQRDTTRTSLIVRNTQAELYAQGSIAWAMDQLRNDWEQQKQGQVIDRMPMLSPVNDVDGYQVSSRIDDMQGRFNLNALATPEAQKDFLRMMLAVVPKLKEEQAQDIMKATVDWISPTSGQTQFSQYYQGLSQPYRAAHRAMVSPSEWQLVKGMTPAIYAALSPYVTALPENTLINIQTAPAPVLMTLGESVTLPAAMAIAATRAQAVPATVKAFLDQDIVKNHHLSDGKMTVSSSYFLVRTDVVIEKQHLLIYTLLQRAAKQNKARITTLWQSIGSW